MTACNGHGMQILEPDGAYYRQTRFLMYRWNGAAAQDWNRMRDHERRL